MESMDSKDIKVFNPDYSMVPESEKCSWIIHEALKTALAECLKLGMAPEHFAFHAISSVNGLAWGEVINRQLTYYEKPDEEPETQE